MKKRNSLRVKVILSTGLLSIVTISLAMVVTFVVDYARDKSDHIQYYQDAIKDSYTMTTRNAQGEAAAEFLPMLSYYASRLNNVYMNNRDKIADFTEEDWTIYYQDIQKAYTPIFGGDFSAKRNSYYLLLQTIANSNYCDDVTTYIYDPDYNRLIIVDSTLGLLGSQSGSIITPTEEEKAYFTEGYKSQDVLDLTDGTTRLSAQAVNAVDPYGNKPIFIRVKTTIPTFQNTIANSDFLIYFFVTLGAIIVLAIIYIVLSHFFIVKRIERLNGATEEFITKLDNNEQLDVVKSNIKANDEIGELADQFESMQESIIDYVKETKENAVKEGFMNSELNIARNIQLNSLPESQYFINNYEINAFINPAKEVGGDFYDYFQIDNDHIAFVIADVSGKGVPASLFMMRAKTLIKSSLASNKSLKEAIITINNELLYRNDLMLFITVFIGILDTSNNKLTYINCGHEHPYIIEKDGSNTLLECESNIPLGLERYDFVVEHLTLKENQSLLLYTDGLSEAINQKTEQFGLKRISASIKNHYFDTNLIKGVFDDMNKFADGQDQFDDVTIMYIRHAENKLHLEYRNPDINVITELIDKTEEFLTKNHKSSQAGVIIDELVNNTINYGFKDNKKALLSFDCYFENDDVVLVFKDNGVKFNPLEVEERQLDENVIGGVGISLMRSLSKKQDYQRVDDMNILTIVL